ncbi:MAG: ketoacyl-ACP synthase III [Cyclobacteriaceae bacterium]|nr:ketoacyl-ACP synthase III [Cyclobacteriaceae bacterium]
MYKSIIKGIGHYVPERVVTNADLEKLMDTSDAWIIERTGIRERRYFDHTKDTTANMASRAAIMAMERAGVESKDIDFIVFATITPDYMFPGSGVLMQRELGMLGIGALDIRNACSGFVYGLSIADQYIKSGMYKNILVIGSEIQSSGLEHNDEGRNVAVIFGDGAGAAVVQRAENTDRGILSTHLHADGTFAEELYVKDPGSSRADRYGEAMQGPGTKPYMNGNLVFKHAVVRFSEVIQEALEANQMDKEQIKLLVPHQANLRISQFIEQKMKLREGVVYNNIQKFGNTTAASIPIALSEAWEKGQVKENDIICLAAFGSGFTWASALIRW